MNKQVHPSSLVYPNIYTHLSIFLEEHGGGMWAPTAEYSLTVVNRADASKSRSTGESL